MPEGERFDIPSALTAPHADTDARARSVPVLTAFQEKLSHLRLTLFGEHPTRAQLERLGEIKRLMTPPKPGEQDTASPALVAWLLVNKWSEKLGYTRGEE